ncbi:MAG: potassium transporter Kup [Alphaproteobacteria bacterium]|nr:potassium transporter Kup [Alphaproteobacteria bacterium]
MTTVAAVSTPDVRDNQARSALMLGALGVVFGDIGTSPIYAFRESLKAAGTGAAEATVLGVLSLVFWAVVLVVAVKYVVFVMRADNQGEGGTMVLLSLAVPAAVGRLRHVLLIIGLSGASLFLGDAMITPAISVLSAIEGMQEATPVFTPYVVPLSALVLVVLFAFQSRGSGGVGRLFGPVMLVWFGVLALVGLAQIAMRPGVLASLDPRYAAAYIGHANPWVAFAVLGSVFLALTGGEALYADMGHFGRHAIRIDWFALVMPALTLNYLGQGALVLAKPNAVSDPFFLMFPSWVLVPAVVLTTAATIIASQAVISGAFTMVQQAMQLGALPRLEVRQTSEEAVGQVYVPQINWLLALAVLGLVLGFRSSDALASAYGLAVSGNMLATTILVTTVARMLWRWPWPVLLPIAGLFIVLDLTFVSANLHKIPEGGWFPLLVGIVTLTLILSWRRGRNLALARRREDSMPLDAFLASLDGPDAPPRVPGTAVYLTTQHESIPSALALNLKHNGVLHKQLVLLKVATERVPRVAEDARATVEHLTGGVCRIELRFGFAERPDVPAALRTLAPEIGSDMANVSFFIGKEVPVPSLHPELPRWQERFYAFMVRNAVSPTDYFLIPPPRVVELGTRIEL